MIDREKAIARARAALDRVLAGKARTVAGDAAELGSIAVAPQALDEERAHRAYQEVLAGTRIDLPAALVRARPLQLMDAVRDLVDTLAHVATRAERGRSGHAKGTPLARKARDAKRHAERARMARRARDLHRREGLPATEVAERMRDDGDRVSRQWVASVLNDPSRYAR